MDEAVIGMPFHLAMQSSLSQRQFYPRAQALLTERDQLKAGLNTADCRLEVSQDTLECVRGCLRSAEADIDQLRAENVGLKTGYAAHEEEAKRLRGEIEALRKDAERYRWVRMPWQDQRRVKAWTSLEVMDENIDAALSKEASQ
jgi:chromosome segregation ATPase